MIKCPAVLGPELFFDWLFWSCIRRNTLSARPLPSNFFLLGRWTVTAWFYKEAPVKGNRLTFCPCSSSAYFFCRVPYEISTCVRREVRTLSNSSSRHFSLSLASLTTAGRWIANLLLLDYIEWKRILSVFVITLPAFALFLGTWSVGILTTVLAWVFYHTVGLASPPLFAFDRQLPSSFALSCAGVFSFGQSFDIFRK